MAKRLVQRIQKGDSEGAITLLEREGSLAWVRDDDTGGYPLHVAAWKVNPICDLKALSTMAHLCLRCMKHHSLRCMKHLLPR